ncbi:hypothetical protein [Paraclostridium sordellii]|nr:hypothetical protein [Paeniclostridium sordellii]QYE99750.1 hypothetical protein KZ987_18010 [Paeniclostridium sordellii]
MGWLELGQVLANYKNVQQSGYEGRNFTPADKKSEELCLFGLSNSFR